MIATAEQLAIQESIRDWAARAGTIATVRAQETAPQRWRDHWGDLAELGIFGLALPEGAGGAGGTSSDLAAALDQVTQALVPGPILTTTVAGLALAQAPDPPKELLAGMISGELTVAAPLTADHKLTETAGTVSGEIGAVLGAGNTTHLLLPAQHGWCLIDAHQPTVQISAWQPVDFSRSLGSVQISAAPIAYALTTSSVPQLSAMLAGTEAAAIAAWCVRTATGYAKTREQFGQAIGTFQAVKHLCTQMLCRATQSAALSWDAARAVDDRSPEGELATTAALALSLDAAVDNAKDCIQVLGGIGFTWEHDAHLYLRRAIALRQLLGGSARWRERTAELTLAGVRRTLRVTVPGDRTGVRGRVREIAALPVGDQRTALAAAGFIAPQWPVPYGLDATPALQLIIDDELAQAGITRPELKIGAWAAPTILNYGTDAQRDRFVGPTLRGEITWCQLFSEPDAGSDLAALRTIARPEAGGWRLTGQKVWTSLAQQADWAICLARTDREVPKHKGISYFLVKMDSPGMEIRPLREITGEAVFNEVFLDGVFVPDDCLLGAPGDGWKLARSTLASERVAMGSGSSLGEELEQLLAMSPVASTALGGLIAEGLAVSLLELRANLASLAGGQPGPESAVRKLLGVAHRQAVGEAALVQCGTGGAAVSADTEGPIHRFLLTRCLSIAGGTTQILSTLVAERVLGLPRS